MKLKITKNGMLYLGVAIFIIFSIIIRIKYFNFISGDYAAFLKPWVEQIRELNGFSSLKENIGNYNVPYMLILTFISYFNCEPLVPIKLVSIIFDLICAIITYHIIYKITNNKMPSLIGGMIVMILPTVVLNGAMWGQCDSIYCSFVLLSVYLLLDKKYIGAFVSLGVAISFKLQAIFILPLYILMLFREHKIKWYYFLIIPLVNFVLCLPSIIAGRSLVDVLTIYLHQTDCYKDLTLNFPNIYSTIIGTEFATAHSDVITLIGIIGTILIFAGLWIMVILKKIDFDFENIINFGLLSVVIATFFLPRMHDRYMYVADILSVIWYLSYRKNIAVPVAINAFIYYIFTWWTTTDYGC